MTDDIPEEDRFLQNEFAKSRTNKPVCEHDFVDSYAGGGLSKKSPDITILVFFCKKCLTIRKKQIDSSDILISPETLDLYGDD